MENAKKIEVVEMKVCDLKTGFGNPRKIQKKKKEDLKKSLETLGDFGLILIDEHDNVIAGNQRVSILGGIDPNTTVLCKRLVGYSDSELKAINIKDNTHAGEWDLDMLSDWMSDIKIDLGIDDLLKKDMEERDVKSMESIRFEKYDYVIIACKNEIDYNELIRNLGLEGKKVLAAKKRTIKARAVWYDEMNAQIVPKDKSI